MNKKNKNAKQTTQRNKREIYRADDNEIYENAKKWKGKEEENQAKLNFSINFNNLLADKKIDQDYFADKINVAVGSISNYRKGKSEPTLTILNKIAEGLNTNINYLIGKYDCPNIDYEFISEKIGLSQKAIQTLFKILHNYFVLEEDVEVDITKEMKISTHYQEELKILNSILSENVFLIQMLDEIKKYKKDKEEYQKMDKEYKEYKDTKDIYLWPKLLDMEKELKRDKFNIFDTFNNIVESITKQGVDKK